MTLKKVFDDSDVDESDNGESATTISVETCTMIDSAVTDVLNNSAATINISTAGAADTDIPELSAAYAERDQASIILSQDIPVNRLSVSSSECLHFDECGAHVENAEIPSLEFNVLKECELYGLYFKSFEDILSVLNPVSRERLVHIGGLNDEIVQELFVADRKRLFSDLPFSENSGSESDADSVPCSEFERNIVERVREIGLFFSNINDLVDWLESDTHAAKFLEILGLSDLDISKLTKKPCIICLDTILVGNGTILNCCKNVTCNECIKTVVKTNVNERRLKIKCPEPSCDKYISKDEIIYHSDPETREKFERFLVDANRDPNRKTCPCCSTITEKPKLDKPKFGKSKKKGLMVTCEECNINWCFLCHSPWHKNMTCEQSKEGNVLLRRWASTYREIDDRNATRCPKCKTYIERISGCNQMNCQQCNCEFCYHCGRRMHSVLFFGDHYSRISVLGCKYNLYRNNSHKRRLIRGSIFSLKILSLPLIISTAPLWGPVIGGLLLYRYFKDTPFC